MRSSKSRSRSKSNRSRSVGNIVNRVFDSSGPEGKVRGTPQQIIDKYNQLARDATLSNDRVAAENFQQHAEHYARLLSEAQREQDARREQQEQQNRDRQQQQQQHHQQQPRDGGQQQNQAQQPQPVVEQPAPAPDAVGDADVVALTPNDAPGDDSMLVVDTPENKPAPRRRSPRKKPAAKAKPDASPQPDAAPQPDVATAAPAAEPAAPAAAAEGTPQPPVSE